MKKAAYTSLTITCVLLVGCTTHALKKNASNQAKTVADLLAEEVLFNYATAKKYFDGKEYNGIPSFVTLASGVSQVTDTLNGTPGIGYPAHGWATGNNFTGTIAAARAWQDNWSFAPVVDPVVLTRLYWLYRSQFEFIGAEATRNIFVNPVFEFKPNFIGNTDEVVMSNNQPQMHGFFYKKAQRSLKDIPGAFDSIHHVTNGWASFTRPYDFESNRTNNFQVSFAGETFWITNRENFFKFAMLALGGTNGTASSSPTQTYQLFGPMLQLRTLPQ